MLKKLFCALFLLMFVLSLNSFAAQQKYKKIKPYKTLPPTITASEGAPTFPKEDLNAVKVSSLIFFRWQKYVSGTGVPNNFDIDRAYIDFRKNLDKNASARLTLDIARINGASRQNLFDFLKYAYVDMPINGIIGKLGLQQTVWIDWAEKMLSLRYVAKTMLDNESVMSSSDFGIGAAGKFSLSNMPEIEYHTTLLNGPGFATAESNSEKAIGLRLNSTLYSAENSGKVLLGAFANSEYLNGSQFGFGLSYQHDMGRFFGEMVTGSKNSKKISGASLGGILNLSFIKNYSIFARIDNFDPDTNVANDERSKLFYGIQYEWSKDIKLALDMQTAKIGNGDTTGIFYLHSMITI